MTTGPGEIHPILERERRARLIEFVQAFREAARDRDLELDTKASEHTKKEVLQPPGRHSVGGAADDVVPVQHDRIVLTPLAGHPPINNVAYLVLHVPTPYQDLYGVDSADGSHQRLEIPQVNDVFIQAIGREGQAYGTYLLNKAGFYPYQRIPTWTFDVEGDLAYKFFDPEDGDAFESIASPERLTELAAPISFEDVEAILIRNEYTYALQQNDLRIT